MRWRGCFLFLLIFICGCSPQRFFYYPNQTLYADPAAQNIPHEIVSFPSSNGKKLYGLWLPTERMPKGTVVHFHGNFGNISNHFRQALFLTEQGYDVLSFDYQGYGASEGHPSAKNTVDDGLASISYALTRDRSGHGVAIFGQSLGGAVGIVVAAKDSRVRGAVIEAGFASYRGMAREALGRRIFFWPFYPFLPLFMNGSLAPVHFVERVSPRPLFFIHGMADTIVSSRNSEQLYAAAKEPKTLWLVPEANHLEVRNKAGGQYVRRINTFLEEAFRQK